MDEANNVRQLSPEEIQQLSPEEIEQLKQQYLQQMAAQQQRNYRTEIQSADTVIQEPYSPDQPMHLLLKELWLVKWDQAKEKNWRLTEQVYAWKRQSPINLAIYLAALFVLFFGAAVANNAFLHTFAKPAVQEAAK